METTIEEIDEELSPKDGVALGLFVGTIVSVVVVSFYLFPRLLENYERNGNPSENTCIEMATHFEYMNASTFEHNYIMSNRCIVRQEDNIIRDFQTTRPATLKEVEGARSFLSF